MLVTLDNFSRFALTRLPIIIAIFIGVHKSHVLPRLAGGFIGVDSLPRLLKNE